MSDRENVCITIADERSYTMPDFVVDMIEWLNEQVAKVPEEHRDDMRFGIETSEEYGITYANVIVSYWRPETDEEMAARAARDRARAEDEKARLRARLAMLESQP